MKKKLIKIRNLNNISRDWFIDNKINARLRIYQMNRLLKMYNNLKNKKNEF